MSEVQLNMILWLKACFLSFYLNLWFYQYISIIPSPSISQCIIGTPVYDLFMPVHGVYVRLCSVSCHLSEKDNGKTPEVAIYR